MQQPVVQDVLFAVPGVLGIAVGEPVGELIHFAVVAVAGQGLDITVGIVGIFRIILTVGP